METNLSSNKIRNSLLAVFIAMVLVFSGCAQQTTPSEENNTNQGVSSEPIEFGLPPWPGVTVKTEVVKQILEEEGYSVNKNELDAGIVYSQLSSGELDVLLAGWLPTTHEEYWGEHSQNLEKVNVNVETTWLGLAVPDYVYESGITSIEDLNANQEQFNSEIVGIEPGAGVMQSTEEAIDTYGLNYTLVDSSTPAMIAEADAAMQENQSIVFTIWEPHSAFAKFDIRKLEDPQSIYGGGDSVYTIARNDLGEEYPQVKAFLEKFNVSSDVQSKWILEYSDKGNSPEEVASQWIENNPDDVHRWTQVFEE